MLYPAELQAHIRFRVLLGVRLGGACYIRLTKEANSSHILSRELPACQWPPLFAPVSGGDGVTLFCAATIRIEKQRCVVVQWRQVI